MIDDKKQKNNDGVEKEALSYSEKLGKMAIVEASLAYENMYERAMKSFFQKEIEKGLQQDDPESKRKAFKTILLTKYGVVDDEWVNSISEDKFSIFISTYVKCDSFDELKKIVDNN